MTIPAITKWRPRFMFYRDKWSGWQWFFYQHTDHNPVIMIQRWRGEWILEFYGWTFRGRRTR